MGAEQLSFNPEHEPEPRVELQLEGNRVYLEREVVDEMTDDFRVELGEYRRSEENDPELLTLNLGVHTIDAEETLAYAKLMREKVGDNFELRISRRKGLRLPERAALESVGAVITHQKKEVVDEVNIDSVRPPEPVEAPDDLVA